VKQSSIRTDLSRRGFVRAAAILPFAATGFNFVSDSAQARVIPVPRSGPTMLKVSLNAFSFSRLLNAKLKHGKDGIDLFDLVDFCAKYGIDGMDPTGYFFPGFPNVPPDAYIFDLKRKAFESGVGISGTGARNNFTTSDKEKRAADVKIIKDWVVVASKLGAPVLRVFADTQMRAMTWRDVAKGFTQEQVREWIADDSANARSTARSKASSLGFRTTATFCVPATTSSSLLASSTRPGAEPSSIPAISGRQTPMSTCRRPLLTPLTGRSSKVLLVPKAVSDSISTAFFISFVPRDIADISRSRRSRRRTNLMIHTRLSRHLFRS